MAKNIVGRRSAKRTGDEDREECERNLQDSGGVVVVELWSGSGGVVVW